MSRHRSPRGRRADQQVAHRSVQTPLRRGAAVVAVTGGAFSLIGAATPTDVPAEVGVQTLSDTTVVPAALVRTSVEPVAPSPQVLDAGELVKAVQLAEQAVARLAAEQQKAAEEQAAQAKAAAEAEAAKATAADCGVSTSGLGSVKPHVRAAAEFLGCLFGEPTMYGIGGRAGTSDHPGGKAIDFMVGRSTGDALADCALRNKTALGITYVIWRQRINYGSGWEAMEDRGGVTANHFDHVHVSFGSGAGGDPDVC